MRRRGRSPTIHTGTNTQQQQQQQPNEFLDTDDQDEIVKSIEHDALEQTRTFQLFFSYIGSFAFVLALVYPLLSYEECSATNTSWTICLIHSFLSAMAHATCVLMGRADPRASVSYFVLGGLICIGSSMILTMTTSSKECFHYHWSLIFGNIVAFLGAGALRWDVNNTLNDIKALENAKYDHKTL